MRLNDTLRKRAIPLLAGLGLVFGTWSRADAQWLLAQRFESFMVGCLAVSGNVFYLGAVAYSWSSGGNGAVLRSTDGGVSWTTLTGTGWPGRGKTPYRNGVAVKAIVINGTTILAGTSNMGILVSKDGGQSWASGGGLPKNAFVTALAMSGPDFYAGSWDFGVFVSRDGGSNWTAVGTGLPPALRATSFAAVGSRLFVGTYNMRIFVSSDGGATWVETDTGAPGADGRRQVRNIVSIGPEVFALFYGLGVYRFQPGDSSWKPVDPAATAGATAMTTAPGGADLFVGIGPTRVLVSKDKGVRWKDAAPGLSAKSPIDVLATDGVDIVGGCLVEAWRLSLAAANPAGSPLPAGAKPVAASADFQTYMTNGDRAWQARDYANGVVYYSKALEADPGSINALIQRALCYLKLGADGYDKGLADLAKIQSIDPANTTIYFTRGEIYRGKASLARKSGNAKAADDFLAQAVAAYELALKADPGSTEIPFGLGRAHQTRGDLDKALAVFAALYDRKPGNDSDVHKALWDLFKEYARQNRDIECGGSARTWYDAGQFFREAKQDGQSVRCFSRAIDLGYTEGSVFLLRSDAYLRLGDLGRALADAEKEVQLNPDSGSFHHRAEIYAASGDYDKAIADMEQAIGRHKKEMKARYEDYRDPTFYAMCWRRGDFYFNKGNWNKAIEDYKLVDESLPPGVSKQAVNLQLALAYKNKGDAANEQKYQDRAKTVGPPKK